MNSAAVSVRQYIDQWLKTATDGNVVCDYAFATDRIGFSCKGCTQTLTVSTNAVTKTSVDYSVQEFVKIHSHKGGHESGKCACGGALRFGESWKTGKCHNCREKIQALENRPTPVTADFKPVVNPFAVSVRRFK